VVRHEPETTPRKKAILCFGNTVPVESNCIPMKLSGRFSTASQTNYNMANDHTDVIKNSMWSGAIGDEHVYDDLGSLNQAEWNQKSFFCIGEDTFHIIAYWRLKPTDV
jgi:hypothetical protein